MTEQGARVYSSTNIHRVAGVTVIANRDLVGSGTRPVSKTTDVVITLVGGHEMRITCYSDAAIPVALGSGNGRLGD